MLFQYDFSDLNRAVDAMAAFKKAIDDFIS